MCPPPPGRPAAAWRRSPQGDTCRRGKADPSTPLLTGAQPMGHSRARRACISEGAPGSRSNTAVTVGSSAAMMVADPRLGCCTRSPTDTVISCSLVGVAHGDAEGFAAVRRPGVGEGRPMIAASRLTAGGVCASDKRSPCAPRCQGTARPDSVSHVPHSRSAGATDCSASQAG
jgi:hypothetical protein